MASYDNDSPRLAETYHRISEAQFTGGQKLVERLEIKPGDRVLDLGCGTGRLAGWIAERVGREGRVTAIDPLPERISIARGRFREIDFAIGGAEDLGAFSDQSFDAVCMNAVLHWIADKPMALAEISRVLRPGGRLGVTTSPRELHWAGTVHSVIASVLIRPTYLEQIDPAALAVMDRHITTTEVLALLPDHGLELLELHIVKREQVLKNGEEAVDFAESSSFGNLLSLVPEPLRAGLHIDMVTEFEKLRRGDEIALQQFVTLLVAERSAGPGFQ